MRFAGKYGQTTPNIPKSICNRCKHGKESIKCFSVENDMAMLNELKDLTQIEEILIARVLPIMNIYCKPKGGQHAYKGHVITFPCNVQRVADVLPHLPTDLPLIKIQKNGSISSKDFRVRKIKVLNALTWLRLNNPVYQDIYIDHSRIKNLPDDGDLRNLPTLGIEENISVSESSNLFKTKSSNSSCEEVPVNLGPKSNVDEHFKSNFLQQWLFLLFFLMVRKIQQTLLYLETFIQMI